MRSFYEAIREYWPGLQDGMLHPAYTGIRPKLINRDGDTDESGATTDFVIQTECEHGAPGLVQLFGFESPGLTWVHGDRRERERILRVGVIE